MCKKFNLKGLCGLTKLLTAWLVFLVIVGMFTCVGEAAEKVNESKWYARENWGQSVKDLDESYTGNVIIEFDVRPLSDNMDCAISYTESGRTIGTWSDMAIQVQFNPDGTIKVRDGNTYTALESFAYQSGQQVHIKIVSDLAARLYDVWVTPDKGKSVQLAAGYAFRDGGPDVDNISQVSIKSAHDDVAVVTNHTVKKAVSLVRINAGGKMIFSKNTVYEEDHSFTGGNTYSVSKLVDTGNIESPAIQEIYQSQRTDDELFSYSFSDLHPNEDYQIRLHFVETEFFERGKRIFNVDLNGEAKLTDYDIFENTDGIFIAAVEEFNCNSGEDGTVTICFSKGAAGEPTVSGIEVLRVKPTLYRVSVDSSQGGSANTLENADFYAVGETVSISATEEDGYTFEKWTSDSTNVFADDSKKETTFVMPDFEITVQAHFRYSYSKNEPVDIYRVNAGGEQISAEIIPYTADAYYMDGAISSVSKNVQTNKMQFPAPMEVYRTQRASDDGFSYTFPNLVAGAGYYIRLHFAETEYAKVGARMFGLTINGNSVMEEYDIYAEVGAYNAVIKEFAQSANADGCIMLEFEKGSVGEPCVSGIEVIFMESDLFLHSLTADNYSYTCRRPFGAGLYDSVSNKTFITYNGYGMSPFVKEFDHTTNRWSEAVEVGVEYPYHPDNIGTEKSWHTYLYHDYPVMTMAPDGSLLVFNVDHTHELFQAKSLTPRSVTGGWDKSRMLTSGLDEAKNCYPMAITAGAEVFVFYSKNDDTWTTDDYKYRTFRAIKSEDNGENWSDPFILIDTEIQEVDGYNEVYSWGGFYNSDNEMIGLTWCMAGGLKKDGTVVHNGASKNLYFAYYDPATNHMFNAAGSDLGETIDVRTMDECLVHEAKGDPDSGTWMTQHPFDRPQASYDSVTGYPVLAYGRYVSEQDRSIKFARWNGITWDIDAIDTSTNWFYDLEKTGSESFRVAIYVSTSGYKLMKTENGGNKWVLEQEADVPLMYGPFNSKVVEATFIENSHATIQMFIGQYNTANSSNSDHYGGKYHVHTAGTLWITP